MCDVGSRKLRSPSVPWSARLDVTDGQGGVGDVNGDRLLAVGAAKRDLLAADHDHSGARDTPLHGDRLGRRAWRWADRADTPQIPSPARREWIRSAAQQLSAVQVEKHQGRFFDADP